MAGDSPEIVDNSRVSFRISAEEADQQVKDESAFSETCCEIGNNCILGHFLDLVDGLLHVLCGIALFLALTGLIDRK